ncbi:MAG: hypothetical protein K1060chlam4_00799 [Candidatus Anoxychlamydiales bacterium]|nr:hypothetical protein [Candidatus Anoxychlamydiales bacterium]
MKLVLFGAGASIGAGLQRSPPLLSNLLKELKIFAPNSWGNLTKDEENFFKKNFEDGMERLLNLKKEKFFKLTFPIQPRLKFLCDLQWDMAIYFFCFVIKINSLYEEILSHSQKAGGTVEYSTLNYDNLLIQAVNRVSNLMSKSKFSVSFPHGNSAFFCKASIDAEGKVTAPQGEPTEFYPTTSGFLQSSGPIELIGDFKKLQERRNQHPLFPPIISHINPDKYVTSGINFIEEQQTKLWQQINKAERIVIIGMSINNNDDHIWQPLRHTKAQILYISGKKSGNQFECWKVKNKRKNDRTILSHWDSAKNDVYDFLSI